MRFLDDGRQGAIGDDISDSLASRKGRLWAWLRRNIALQQFVLQLVLLLFLLVCIFDPANRLTGAKVWLFLLGWIVTLICFFSRPKSRPYLPSGLLFYTVVFLAIPLLSIGWYLVTNGSQPYAGFGLLKGYLLVTLAAMLVVNRVDLLPSLCGVLSALALVIVIVFLMVKLNQKLFLVLWEFGKEYGIVLPDCRDYGSGQAWLQIYFVTSPMLVIAIAYYFNKAWCASGIGGRLFNGGLVVLNVLGMFTAGSRNNMFGALLLLFLLLFFHMKHKVLALVATGGMVLILTSLVFNSGVGTFFACSSTPAAPVESSPVASFNPREHSSSIPAAPVESSPGALSNPREHSSSTSAAPVESSPGALFNPREYSNSIKLALLEDYKHIFSDPVNLILGQGLGAYHYWEAKGKAFFISELTYLEMIRNFGLLGALVMLGMLLVPIWYAFVMQKSLSQKALALGYGVYLIMCFSNPNLFSSMGILILSILLGKLYLSHNRIMPLPPEADRD